jgi:hypothetical protein
VSWRKNPEQEFNTQGKQKCPHCGLYFPEAWIYNHMTICANNPANQEEDDG